MNRAAWATVIVVGCGGHGQPTFDAGADASDFDAACALTLCDEHNPCEQTTCVEGMCSRVVSPKGTICEGMASDPIHGECDGDPQFPTCNITEWTCLRNPPGTACLAGICAKNMVCCSGGCLTTDGACRVTDVAHCGASGSACMPCPEGSTKCLDDGTCV